MCNLVMHVPPKHHIPHLVAWPCLSMKGELSFWFKAVVNPALVEICATLCILSEWLAFWELMASDSRKSKLESKRASLAPGKAEERVRGDFAFIPVESVCL